MYYAISILPEGKWYNVLRYFHTTAITTGKKVTTGNVVQETNGV